MTLLFYFSTCTLPFRKNTEGAFNSAKTCMTCPIGNFVSLSLVVNITDENLGGGGLYFCRNSIFKVKNSIVDAQRMKSGGWKGGGGIYLYFFRNSIF